MLCLISLLIVSLYCVDVMFNGFIVYAGEQYGVLSDSSIRSCGYRYRSCSVCGSETGRETSTGTQSPSVPCACQPFSVSVYL